MDPHSAEGNDDQDRSKSRRNATIALVCMFLITVPVMFKAFLLPLTWLRVYLAETGARPAPFITIVVLCAAVYGTYRLHRLMWKRFRS